MADAGIEPVLQGMSPACYRYTTQPRAKKETNLKNAKKRRKNLKGASLGQRGRRGSPTHTYGFEARNSSIKLCALVIK